MGEVISLPNGAVPQGAVPHERRGPIEPLWRELLGHELREERHRQERTLKQVADDAGISTPYLSEIERGIKEPSSEVIDAVRGALGLRLVDLTYRVTRTLAVSSGPSTRPTGPVALAA